MVQSLIAALLLNPAGQAGSKDFASDERLKRPIALHDKIVSLKTFTEHLQRESGVSMEVGANIADRKITAIFRDRPVAEVMRAVKTLFFMDWQPTNTGYRLILPNQIQNEEKGILAIESQMAKATIEKRIAEWAEIDQTPEETLASERKRLSDEWARLRTDTSEAGRARFALVNARFTALSEPIWPAVATSLAPHLGEHVQRLLDGAIVFASSRSSDSVPQMSPDFLKARGFGNHKYTGALAMVQYNEDDQTLGGPVRLFEDSGGIVTTLLGTSALVSEDSPQWTSAPLVKRMAKWASEANLLILERKLSLPEPPKPQTGYLNKTYSLAEHLEYIAARADLPVIADAYRMSVSPEGFFPVDKVGAYLASIRSPFKTSRPYNQVLVHASDGWLMARTDAYWRQLAKEIPERILAPLEEKAASKTGASVEDFAAFAAKLTPVQVRGLFQSAGTMIVRFSTHPLNSARSLRLLSALSPAQRVQAQKPEGLSLVDMTDEQRGLYFEALAALLREGQVPESLLPSFFPNANVDRASLAWFYRCMRGKTMVWPETQSPPGQMQQPENIDGWSVHFEFGAVRAERAATGFQMAAGGPSLGKSPESEGVRR